MTFDMERVAIELENRGVVSVEHAVGTRIECIRGRIWITEEGGAGDVVLEAGQSHEASRGGVAVVQALRAALVVFRARAVLPAETAPRPWAEWLWTPWTARAAGARPAVAQPVSG
jgi:hypothetical protein